MTDPALAEVWRKYRSWAKRARTIRSDLDSWRRRVLILTVLGAVLATAAAQLSDLQTVLSFSTESLARLLSAASAAAMALAAYSGRSMLDPVVERQWLRARALAESCKSESFRFATKAPPYDGAEAAERLLGRLQGLLASGADIPSIEVDEEEAVKGMPSYPLSVEGYVQQRLIDQIDGYYRPKAKFNEERATKCTRWMQGLGALAAVLGAIGAIYGGGQISAWVAAVGTVVAAIGAFALSQRYQGLAAVYRATADRLALRRALWQVARLKHGDPIVIDREFVIDCEAIMAAENEAWLAEFLKEPASPSPAPENTA